MPLNQLPHWKTAMRCLTPPILWNAASSVAHAARPRCTRLAEGNEQDSTYYDQMYQETTDYSRHYTGSRYYFLWCVIVDRMKREGTKAVLDIGCGPGQFASLLRDQGIPRYCGIDLSPEAIRMANTVCPECKFVAASVFDSDLLENHDYDAVVSLEFLEHVHEDIDVLKRIRRGRTFYGTVPDFPYESHVRHFTDCAQVRERYGSLFSQFHVDEFPAKGGEIRYFLMEGVRD
jgi:SAM-dependent methyltransferase